MLTLQKEVSQAQLLATRKRSTLKRREWHPKSARSQLRASMRKESSFSKQKRIFGADVLLFIKKWNQLLCFRLSLNNTTLALLSHFALLASFSSPGSLCKPHSQRRYMGRTSTSSRSLFKELSVSGLTSVFLGLGAFFIFLSAGIYLWVLMTIMN